jgi:RNA polymerase sigma factor for flagellar operon FliA
MSRVKTLYPPKRDKETIDKMVTDYLPLVRYIVGRLPLALPPMMDEDDLISVGVLGLINAAKTYDPNVGASFKTYAYTNIKGSILDELRRHDTVPRSARDKMKKVEEVTSRLIEETGRVPTPDEIAKAMSMPLKALDELLLSTRTTVLFSLNDHDYRMNETGGLLESLSDRTSENPADLAEQAEAKALLVRALTKLPETERQVVFLYYNKNMLLREIGQVLNVSESRICQILGRAHFLLNKEIENMGG